MMVPRIHDPEIDWVQILLPVAGALWGEDSKRRIPRMQASRMIPLATVRSEFALSEVIWELH